VLTQKGVKYEKSDYTTALALIEFSGVIPGALGEKEASGRSVVV
jgi:hypothetical protein